ncbi:cytochrome P450 [Dendrothele bispora CBS 962.96]|uniref:Cytochrome P450 n=1 Tax=Dendrothele bispora (strain CBS 962.96) TaxID=1314807 RepID=A0A4S8KTH3_DENBC|nr:cytochrome P450 [Dendrothele bispora CBS 962.96]
MLSSNLFVACLVVGLTVLILLVPRISRRRQSLPLPPGPRKSPIIGNLLNMPRGFEWFTYMRWGREYKSDIIHLDVLGSSILIVNSSEAAFELMDRRSSIYSSSWKEDFIFMPYGNLWRECRKLFHQELNPSDPAYYEPNALRASRLLLNNVLRAPEDWRYIFRYMAGTLILSITYGITARPSSDPFIQAAEVALKSVTEAARPGAFLVDQFPWLQYIPAWFPGASFKKKAREWRMYKDRMTNGPFDVVMKEIEDGMAQQSFILRAYNSESNNDKKTIALDSMNALAGGTATTLAAFSSFVLAMVCNPQYQHKAQKQIGYRIPKNTTIVPNVWAMLHDEVVYGPEPDKFNPERFLTKDGALNLDIPDPDADFGFGRRICPGRHVALSSLWISIASVLATFNLEKARDENGRVIEPSGEYIPSSIQNHPAPFDCLITPRSREHEQLIQESLQ